MPYLAKRVLIAIILDISPSTGDKNSLGSETPNKLINKKLQSLISQLCGNGKIRSALSPILPMWRSGHLFR